jgi:hypothetical protein
MTKEGEEEMGHPLVSLVKKVKEVKDPKASSKAEGEEAKLLLVFSKKACLHHLPTSVRYLNGYMT